MATEATTPKTPPPAWLRKFTSWLGRYWIQTVGLALGAVIWEIAGRSGVSPAFPPLSAVIDAGLGLWTSERFLDALDLTP